MKNVTNCFYFCKTVTQNLYKQINSNKLIQICGLILLNNKLHWWFDSP